MDLFVSYYFFTFSACRCLLTLFILCLHSWLYSETLIDWWFIRLPFCRWYCCYVVYANNFITFIKRFKTSFAWTFRKPFFAHWNDLSAFLFSNINQLKGQENSTLFVTSIHCHKANIPLDMIKIHGLYYVPLMDLS